MSVRARTLALGLFVSACAARSPTRTLEPAADPMAPPDGLTHLDEVATSHCEEIARLTIIAGYGGQSNAVRGEALRRLVARTGYEVEASPERAAIARACLETNAGPVTNAIRDLEAYGRLFALMALAPSVMTTARVRASLDDAPVMAQRGTFPIALVSTLAPDTRALLVERDLFPRAALNLDDVNSGRVRVAPVLRDALVDTLVRDGELATIRVILGRLRAEDPDDVLAFVVARGLDEPTLDDATRHARLRDFVSLVTPARGCAETAAFARLFAADQASLLTWQRLAFAEVLRHAELVPDAARALDTLANRDDPELSRFVRLVADARTAPLRVASRSTYFHPERHGTSFPIPPASCAALDGDVRALAVSGAMGPMDMPTIFLMAVAMPSEDALACFIEASGLSFVERVVLADALARGRDLRALAQAAEAAPYAFAPLARDLFRRVRAGEAAPELDVAVLSELTRASARVASIPELRDPVMPYQQERSLTRAIPPLGLGMPRRCRVEDDAPGTADAEAELAVYLRGERDAPDLAHAVRLGVLQRLVRASVPSRDIALAQGDLALAAAYAREEGGEDVIDSVRAALASGDLREADLVPLFGARSPDDALVVARRNPRAIAARWYVLRLAGRADPMPARSTRRAIVAMAKRVIADDVALAIPEALAALHVLGTERELEAACARVTARDADHEPTEACDGYDEDSYGPPDDDW